MTMHNAIDLAEIKSAELTHAVRDAHRLACGDGTKLHALLLIDLLGEAARLQKRIEQVAEAMA